MAPVSRTQVKLSDVAHAAGVSVTTASRALNGRAKAFRISEKTAANVRDVAAKLGFQPSQVARSLQSQRTGLVGVVVPDVANPFFAAIAREITLAAEAAEFSVLLADSQEDTNREIKLVQAFCNRQVEALVVCPVGIAFDHLHEVERSGRPLVLVDRTSPQQSFLQVTSGHRTGAQAVTQLLLDQGHRRIGIVQGLPGTLPNEARRRGVADALHAVGLSADSVPIAGDNFTEQSGYQAASQLLKERPQLTALIAFSAPNAFGALRAAQQVGRHVPDELSLVAFDDSPFADFMQVPVSTAAQNVAKLGQRAAELVLSVVQTGQPPAQRLHEIDVSIIQRSSIQEITS